jgi:alcohol dehydrogenase (cytochrome c)
MRILLLLLPVCASVAQVPSSPDTVAAGQKSFEGRCSGCHGSDGNGGELGPPIARRVSRLNDTQLAAVISGGFPNSGMPGFKLADTELNPLIGFLRSLRPQRPAMPIVRQKVEIENSKVLDGLVLNQTFADMQLRTDDNRIHLLRKTPAGYREVTSSVDWSTYNGDRGGNRFTTQDQINKATVGRLAPYWIFPLPNTSNLQVTPIVVEGVMYVTSGNECYALDAGSGRAIWHYQRPRTTGLIGNAAGGANRGVAVAGDRVFMVTDNAHLIALNRGTGELVWETEMADWRQNYNATSAPLTVGDLVISGTAGGEEGVRGFLAAYSQSTGKEVWRFWTVPKPGESGSDTWKGKGIEHGGAVAWFTGVYDAELDTLYWPTGNPGQDYNGDQRGGDNLYSDCILALDPKTGKLKWHYQTTPHDLWDWDASETPIVANVDWEGHPRKLLIQANRNGFFYVLDRTNGNLLLGKQFIDKLTWASGIGADGRPIMIPGQEPSEKGTRVCPSQDGATNWFSPSFNASAGLYFVQTYEKCSVYTKRQEREWEAGHTFLGGAQRIAREDKPQRILRAIDIHTGKVKWEVPQPGPASSWGGTLATAGGLVFFGEDSGSFAASDAGTGAVLWSFQTNVNWKASPMTYSFDGKQIIAVAAGSNIIAFASRD